MNWRKFILPGCIVACVLAPSIGMTQSNPRVRIGTKRTSIPVSARVPRHHPPMPSSMGRMPTHRAPGMNSAAGLGRFNHFNYGDFNRADRFHRIEHFNQIIFIGNFASRWWWTPWWAWNWVYPYGSSLYPYPSAYYPSEYMYDSYSYGYGNASPGYDYGYMYPPLRYYDYTNDDEGAVRDVLAEYEVSWNGRDSAALARLFTEDAEYVNTDGVHWNGVQEIVRAHTELFRKKSKSAVRKLTGVEVQFSTPDVALVHATWDVSGAGRAAAQGVPALKGVTTMTVVKNGGKWLITSFRNTESGTE